MKRKSSILLILFTFICLNPIIAEPSVSNNKIVLIIDGESYTKDYPTTIEEYKDLVDGLVDMYNTLDKDNRDLKTKDAENTKVLNAKIDELVESNKALQSQVDKVYNDYGEYKSSIDSILKTNTKCNFLFNFGPAFQNGKTGTFSDVTVDWRIFRNLHFGLTGGISVYNSIETLEGRVGLVVGYSLY